MSSADTGLSHNHNRVPYDSDDQDGRRIDVLNSIDVLLF